MSKPIDLFSGVQPKALILPGLSIGSKLKVYPKGGGQFFIHPVHIVVVPISIKLIIFTYLRRHMTLSRPDYVFDIQTIVIRLIALPDTDL